MFPLLQLIINGLVIGSIYALVASGFSLIYATNRVMHFAHGASVTFAAYTLYQTYGVWHIPFFVSCVITLALAGLLGLVMTRLVYQPLQARKASQVILLIASIGIMLLIENLILLFFGSNIKTIDYVGVGTSISIWGASITALQLVIVCTALVLVVFLYLFMYKTRLGRYMRAVSDNKELAVVTGIDKRKIADWSFMVGSALAGIAGILIGLEGSLMPTMGFSLMIKGFTGAIVGGISFIPGSIVGSLVLGLLENFGIWFLASGYKDAIAFALLFIFLLFRPKGLFGRRDAR